MQGLGSLGKTAVIDHGLQGTPLIKGDTGRFHQRFLFSNLGTPIWRVPMKNCCLVLLALLPLSAVAYPTELKKQLNGADVSASVQQIDRHIGGLTLYNYGEAAARCSAVFRSGPEAPRTRTAELGAGESVTHTVRFSRDIIRLRVDLTCEQK